MEVMVKYKEILGVNLGYRCYFKIPDNTTESIIGALVWGFTRHYASRIQEFLMHVVVDSQHFPLP
jgi:hypothetical protein